MRNFRSYNDTMSCKLNYVLLWEELIIGTAVHTIDIINFSPIQLTETMCKLIGYHNR